MALQHPVVNATCKDGKSFTNNSSINIAVAVAMDGGLITPVLQDADKLDIYLLSQRWKELVGKARAMQLQPNECKSGTVTLSNLGMFGVDRFDAILPPGQGGIMAVGASKPTFIADDRGFFALKNKMLTYVPSKMWGLAVRNRLSLPFGILGNILSFLAFLAPVSTFLNIRRRNSTEGFQSLSYIISFLSSLLWLYYGLRKIHSLPIVTINTDGGFIETVYIILFIYYTRKKEKIVTGVIFLLDLTIFGLLILFTRLSSGDRRSLQVKFLGWICTSFSIAVFVAPLFAIMSLFVKHHNILSKITSVNLIKS